MNYNTCKAFNCFAFRNLPGGFILIRGELKDVPVGLVQGKVVEYKYGLAKREEGEVKFLYEELLECEPLTNRCLEIPAQARKDGGKGFYIHIDSIDLQTEAPTS